MPFAIRLVVPYEEVRLVLAADQPLHGRDST